MSRHVKPLPIDLINEYLVLDSETGILTWKKPRSGIRVGQEAGGISNYGYQVVMLDGMSYRSHRIVYYFVTGVDPGDMFIDHIDGNPQNNRPDNLRLATHSQNLHNQGKRKHNTSGFKGVTWHKITQKWQASIRVNGKRKHLGLFETSEQAHEAYCQAARELHGEFRHQADLTKGTDK